MEDMTPSVPRVILTPIQMEDSGYLEPGSPKHRQPPHPDSQRWLPTQQPLSHPSGKQGLYFVLLYNTFLTWLRRKILIKFSLGSFIFLSTYIFLLSTCYMSDTSLGSGECQWTKHSPFPQSRGQTDNKQIKIYVMSYGKKCFKQNWGKIRFKESDWGCDFR